MLTYSELYDLIATSGFDQDTKNMYFRYLDNAKNATWMSEYERQRKYEVLLNAIDARNEAIYFNRWDVIVKDTLAESVPDLLRPFGNLWGILSSPVFLIVVLLLIVGLLTATKAR